MRSYISSVNSSADFFSGSGPFSMPSLLMLTFEMYPLWYKKIRQHLKGARLTKCVNRRIRKKDGNGYLSASL